MENGINLTLLGEEENPLRKAVPLVCNVCSFALFALLSFHARGKPKSPSMLFIESTGFYSSQKTFFKSTTITCFSLKRLSPSHNVFFYWNKHGSETALASKCGSICGIATALVQNLHVKVEQWAENLKWNIEFCPEFPFFAGTKKLGVGLKNLEPFEADFI